MDGLRAAISQGPGLVIFRILIVILLVYVLYSLYIWLNGGVTDLKDYVIYSSPNSGLPAISTNANPITYSGVDKIPGIYPGGEFSVSTWIYINKWTATENKVFLTLSGGGTGTGTGSFKTMVMYLGKTVNKLGVRLSHGNTVISDITEIRNPTTGGPYCDVSTCTSAANGFDKCDIEQVNLQKWVNITAAVSGRTVDIYIDGKLSRSCVLDQMYKVDEGENPTLTLCGGTGIGLPNGFGGYIGQTRVANFAYSPDQVYKNYLSGPFDNSLWSIIMSQLNPSQYSFNIQRNGQNVMSGSTSPP
jgi:hypothetical protein